MDRGPQPAGLLMAKAKIRHPHCWHIVSSTWDGMADRGWDNETCCHCGVRAKHHWRRIRDPKHGPHVETMKLKYDTREECP